MNSASNGVFLSELLINMAYVVSELKNISCLFLALSDQHTDLSSKHRTFLS